MAAGPAHSEGSSSRAHLPVQRQRRLPRQAGEAGGGRGGGCPAGLQQGQAAWQQGREAGGERAAAGGGGAAAAAAASINCPPAAHPPCCTVLRSDGGRRRLGSGLRGAHRPALGTGHCELWRLGEAPQRSGACPGEPRDARPLTARSRVAAWAQLWPLAGWEGLGEARRPQRNGQWPARAAGFHAANAAAAAAGHSAHAPRPHPARLTRALPIELAPFTASSDGGKQETRSGRSRSTAGDRVKTCAQATKNGTVIRMAGEGQRKQTGCWKVSMVQQRAKHIEKRLEMMQARPRSRWRAT